VILDRMVTAYQTAVSYSDRATVQIIGKMSPPDAEPVSWECIVACLKPNRLRLEVNEGIFVSDGEDCYAQIRPLPGQVLHFTAPEQWTLETLFQDVHLDSAMELGLLPQSVLRFPPQLVLLFANNPLNTFCPKGAKIEWVEQQPIGQVQCDIIRISHSDGHRLLWISQESSALLRLDYQPVGLPVPKGFESIEAIRIELTDARFNWDFVPETFQMLQSPNAVQVTEFQSDTPGLPTAEEHRRRLKLMTDSDTYRLMSQPIEPVIPPEQPPVPQEAPRTFTLSPIWSQPLIGVDTMALLPGKTPKLLIPCEGNLVAVLNLQGKVLQKITPEGLADSIIVNIKSSLLPAKRRIGISTVEGKFYLYDELFKPIVIPHPEPHTESDKNTASDKNKMGTIRDFGFELRSEEEEMLLLGIQQNSAQENTTTVNSTICAMDLQGTKHWDNSFEGVLNQISGTVMDEQFCVLASYTAAQDSILVFSSDGTTLDPVEIPFGRHILWFHVGDSTIYTLVEQTDTGDIRFIGFNRQGKGQWSRLLPAGEYGVDPVCILSEQKWLVPSPGGKIFVFDQIGNMIDTFSLNIIPTGLLCVEIDGITLLIAADGETVSAWKMEKIPGSVR